MITNRQDDQPPLAIREWGWRYHHIGIPTTEIKEGEKHLPQFKFYMSGFDTSPFGIEWMRYEPDSPVHDLIKRVPHIAFEVDDLDLELSRHPFNVITPPNAPGEGIRVAMIEHNGAPIELIEFKNLNGMNKRFINPQELFNSTQYGFSQVVVTDPGRLVFISGQVGWDEKMNMAGKGDIRVQAEKAVENIRIAIESAGGTLENIVLLRIYKVKYRKEDGPVISSVLKQYFGTSSPPASTWISVDRLANEDFMIEIEAQAII